MSLTKVEPGRVYSLLQLMHLIELVADVARTCGHLIRSLAAG